MAYELAYSQHAVLLPQNWVKTHTVCTV